MLQIWGAVLEHIGSPRPYAESRPISIADLDLAPRSATRSWSASRRPACVTLNASVFCLPVVHGLPKQVRQNRFAHLSRSVLQQALLRISPLREGHHVIFGVAHPA